MKQHQRYGEGADGLRAVSAVWMMAHIAGQRRGGAGCWGTPTAPSTTERQATAVVGRGNGRAVPAEGGEEVTEPMGSGTANKSWVGGPAHPPKRSSGRVGLFAA